MYRIPLKQCDECGKRITLEESPLQLRTRCLACTRKYGLPDLPGVEGVANGVDRMDC